MNKPKFNSETIDNALNTLSVNSRGHIRGKGRANDKILSDHLKVLDSELTDIRVFVAKLSTGYTTKQALEMIDEFIYKKQVQ